MLISKFDLYKNEWLDLVFADRNTTYGAYELRQHNSRVTAQALVAMIISISIVAFVFGVVLKPVIKPVVRITQVVQDPLVKMPPPVQPDKPVPPKAPKTPPAPPQHIATTRFVPLVVKPQEQVTEEPPKIDALQGQAISAATQTGTTGGTPAIDPPGSGSGGTGDDETVHNAGFGLEREPMPVGGMAAFSKFISKHLHFPPEAQEAHVGGRVFVSFIVEKDGSLSSFTILRGPGYGTNEEALRVLKLAPAWVPGLQNDKPVRVQYNIPINFQLNDDDSN